MYSSLESCLHEQSWFLGCLPDMGPSKVFLKLESASGPPGFIHMGGLHGLASIDSGVPAN